MKTAVSVPNDIFNKAERLARAAGRSRSDVYSAALREYVARHDPDEVTEAIDRAMAELGQEATPDAFGRETARRLLANSEW
jgi:predicted transcriptional regulator